MGNCLVTKLKGVAQNDNLRKLGEVRIEIISTPSNNTGFTIADNGSPQELEILTDGATFAGGSTIFTPPLHTSPVDVSVSAPCVISIKSKYNLTRISQDNRGARLAFSIDDFKYSSVEVFSLAVNDAENNNNITGNIKNLPSTTTYFRIKRGNIVGDFDDFSKEMTEIELTATKGVVGTINNYASSTLSNLILESNDTITGCFEYLCQNAINAGKTSGTLRLVSNTKIKVVNSYIGEGGERFATFSPSGCVIGTTSGGSNVATCVKSGTAGSYTFTWTDGNGNTYVPEV